jgi:hypothetical protein
MMTAVGLRGIPQTHGEPESDPGHGARRQADQQSWRRASLEGLDDQRGEQVAYLVSGQRDLAAGCGAAGVLGGGGDEDVTATWPGWSAGTSSMPMSAPEFREEAARLVVETST